MRTLVVGGSVIVLVQIAAVLLCWRFGAMRGRAVAFAEEPGPSVWDALDRHLASQPAEVLRDESREPVHPLMREIYGALRLARDGVDIERGAPKEWVP